MNKGSVSRFLMVVVIFLMVILGIGAVVIKPSFFMTNPYFNGTIGAIWLMGVAMTCMALMGLWREEGVFYQKSHRFLKILRPLAQLYERSPQASRSSVEHALDQCYRLVPQEVLRYIAGSLIFLGLLGTLWGLSETIVGIADVIGHLPGQDAAEGFLEHLKTQLQVPLAGMGVAFSSSLLGVAGTLTMGFLMVQLDRAKEEFFQKTEIWAFHLFKTQDGIGGSPVEMNSDASFARWADSIERLGRLYGDAEKRQKDLLDGVTRFGEKTQNLLDLIKVQHFVMNKWSEEQMHTRQVLERVAQKMQEMHWGGDESIQSYLAQITSVSQEMLRHMADASWVDTLRHELSVQKRLDWRTDVKKDANAMKTNETMRSDRLDPDKNKPFSREGACPCG